MGGNPPIHIILPEKEKRSNELIKELEAERDRCDYDLGQKSDFLSGTMNGIEIAIKIVRRFMDRRVVKGEEAKFKIGYVVHTTSNPNMSMIVESVYWSHEYGEYVYILDHKPNHDFYGILEESYLID